MFYFRGAEMIPGLMGMSEMIVKEEDLVSRLGNISIDVLSTPRLVQLIEEAAINAIQNITPPDRLSLGTQVKIKHLSATPFGMKVTGHAILKEIHKNRLLFWVDAYDEKEKVAEGEHERVLVSREHFIQKVEQKKSG
jgi:predicted thioesterase